MLDPLFIIDFCYLSFQDSWVERVRGIRRAEMVGKTVDHIKPRVSKVSRGM